MGKVWYYDRLFFVLLTATTFIVSGNASTKKIDDILERIRYGIVDFDKYFSMKFQYADYRNEGSDFVWKYMESEENATNLSDDQFVDGKVSIDLPFGFPFFDRIVTRVAVTKEGIIQSDEPSVNWTIAPLKAKIGMTRSNISYLSRENDIYIQWNNFRFDHIYFKEHDFSFQVRLSARGDIVFVYKRVPYHLKLVREACKCLENEFGVKYSYEEVRPAIEKRDDYPAVPASSKTYELGYSVNFDKLEVRPANLIRFSMADTCVFQKSCEDCTETKFRPTPQRLRRCFWCPKIERCSSLRDSVEGEWYKKTCHLDLVEHPYFCNNIDWGKNPKYVFLGLIGIGIVAAVLILIGILLKYMPDRLYIALFVCNNDQEEQEVENRPNDGENDPARIQDTPM